MQIGSILTNNLFKISFLRKFLKPLPVDPNKPSMTDGPFCGSTYRSLSYSPSCFQDVHHCRKKKFLNMTKIIRLRIELLRYVGVRH